METENWFLGERVATFMCTGYTFLSSLEMGHQLSQKLPRDAGHFGSTMDMKKKHWFSVFLSDEISSNFDLYKGFLLKKMAQICQISKRQKSWDTKSLC